VGEVGVIPRIGTTPMRSRIGSKRPRAALLLLDVGAAESKGSEHNRRALVKRIVGQFFEKVSNELDLSMCTSRCLPCRVQFSYAGKGDKCTTL
jgi:hypothetical protein